MTVQVIGWITKPLKYISTAWWAGP